MDVRPPAGEKVQTVVAADSTTGDDYDVPKVPSDPPQEPLTSEVPAAPASETPIPSGLPEQSLSDGELSDENSPRKRQRIQTLENTTTSIRSQSNPEVEAKPVVLTAPPPIITRNEQSSRENSSLKPEKAFVLVNRQEFPLTACAGAAPAPTFRGNFPVQRMNAAQPPPLVPITGGRRVLETSSGLTYCPQGREPAVRRVVSVPPFKPIVPPGSIIPNVVADIHVTIPSSKLNKKRRRQDENTYQDYVDWRMRSRVPKKERKVKVEEVATRELSTASMWKFTLPSKINQSKRENDTAAGMIIFSDDDSADGSAEHQSPPISSQNPSTSSSVNQRPPSGMPQAPARPRAQTQSHRGNPTSSRNSETTGQKVGKSRGKDSDSELSSDTLEQYQQMANKAQRKRTKKSKNEEEDYTEDSSEDSESSSDSDSDSSTSSFETEEKFTPAFFSRMVQQSMPSKKSAKSKKSRKHPQEDTLDKVKLIQKLAGKAREKTKKLTKKEKQMEMLKKMMEQQQSQESTSEEEASEEEKGDASESESEEDEPVEKTTKEFVPEQAKNQNSFTPQELPPFVPSNSSIDEIYSSFIQSSKPPPRRAESPDAIKISFTDPLLDTYLPDFASSSSAPLNALSRYFPSFWDGISLSRHEDATLAKQISIGLLNSVLAYEKKYGVNADHRIRTVLNMLKNMK